MAAVAVLPRHEFFTVGAQSDLGVDMAHLAVLAAVGRGRIRHPRRAIAVIAAGGKLGSEKAHRMVTAAFAAVL